MAHRKQPHTHGGTRLRALREARSKTQLDVELDAKLGIGYLQRLELGKVQQPEQDTLERILAALDARFRERREVLETFGYTATISIPEEIDMNWATRVFDSSVNQDGIPAYLLDCAHRLLAWNPLVPRLFGEFPVNARGISMPGWIFDRKDGIAASILNADTFFPAQIRVLDYERQRCSDPEWASRFVEDMRRYDVFDHYWSQHSSADYTEIPLRPFATLKLNAGRDESSQFRLIAEPFTHDPRFRVIYAIPDDPATLRLCMGWRTQDIPVSGAHFS